jgi:hypothetical protein
MHLATESSPHRGNNIYLDDTIETITFEKDALEVKFRHNINELSTKNIHLSAILKALVAKEQEDIASECDLFKKMVDTCISLQDSLTSLDALEKKTEILKQQVNAIKEDALSRQK